MALQTTALEFAGQTGGSDAVEARANVFEMTQAAEEAVLRPSDAGAWPHPLRAALAARIAAQNAEQELASHFAAGAGEFAALADPAADGAGQGLSEVIAFMDKVAAQTREVAGSDIAGLKAAGVSDADIVRLCELNAFLAYQVRVIAGLRLMKEGFA